MQLRGKASKGGRRTDWLEGSEKVADSECMTLAAGSKDPRFKLSWFVGYS